MVVNNTRCYDHTSGFDFNAAGGRQIGTLVGLWLARVARSRQGPLLRDSQALLRAGSQ